MYFTHSPSPSPQQPCMRKFQHLHLYGLVILSSTRNLCVCRFIAPPYILSCDFFETKMGTESLKWMICILSLFPKFFQIHFFALLVLLKVIVTCTFYTQWNEKLKRVNDELEEGINVYVSCPRIF